MQWVARAGDGESSSPRPQAPAEDPWSWMCRRRAGRVASPRGAGMASFGCGDQSRLWQAPALEGALSSERSLVLCGMAPLRRVQEAQRGRQRRHREGAAGLEHSMPSWAPTGVVVPLSRRAASCGDGCASLDAARCGGCADGGVRAAEGRACPRTSASGSDPACRPALRQGAPETAAGRQTLAGAGCFGAGGIRSCPCLVLPGPARCPALPAAQALPSPLLSASPGPRFCQPSAYQQEVKRLPESEVRTQGWWAPRSPERFIRLDFKVMEQSQCLPRWGSAGGASCTRLRSGCWRGPVQPNRH